MKKLISVAAVLVAVTAPVAWAQDAPPPRAFLIEDDEEKQIREIEEALGEILVLDESGMPVMREEMQEILPEGVPLDRINMMLGTFVEVDDDGKFRLTESARPYLPMLKNFLRPEIMERLRKLRTMSPEERKAELQKLLEEQQQEGGNFGMRPREEPRSTPEPRRTNPEPRRVAPRATDGASEGQLDRIERRLARIEELLERTMESHERFLEGRGPNARGERRGLGGLFGRREGRRGLDLGKGLRRARTLADGMRRLSDIATPEDMDLLRRMLSDSGLKLEDLRNRDELFDKMQKSMEPQDMGRMMELFSEFMGTDEGRRFVEELDGMAEDFEGMMNGERGERMGQLMERLEGMLGGEGKALDTLRKLTQGRDRDRAPSAKRDDHHRSTPKRLHRESKRSAPDSGRSKGSRLY